VAHRIADHIRAAHVPVDLVHRDVHRAVLPSRAHDTESGATTDVLASQVYARRATAADTDFRPAGPEPVDPLLNNPELRGER